MWRIYFPKAAHGAVVRASLLQSLIVMSRRISVLLGVTMVLLFILTAPPRPGPHGWQIFGITCLWVAATVGAYMLAARHLLKAHALLLGAAVVLLPLAVAVSGQGLLTALYAGLPALAVTLIGWPAGLAASLYVAVAPLLLAGAGLAPPLSLLQAIVLIGLGALGALISWSVVGALLELAETALIGLGRAQAEVDAARSQRLELKQVEEDLLQATREQSRLLERLKAMHQIAEEARQTKQEFIAKVSHELRTPLNMIIAYSELITASPKVYGRIPGALLADMAVIHRNSQHLSRLVDDVLDLSQIDAGRMALSKCWTDLAVVAAEATEAVRPLFQTKGLYLEVDAPETLPQVYCDPTRIRQVMMNLLSNAGRFTIAGGVRVRFWTEEDDIKFSVADTGPGIALQDQEHLFEPFQQIDASLRRRHGGSGLGLNISKQFVEMHGGRIWLETCPGQGSIFYVSLPLAPAAVDLPDTPAARRWVHPYTAYVPRTRPRVAPVPDVKPRYVVMEHGHTLTRLLTRYLPDNEVVRVESLEDGLRLLGESPARAFVVNSALLPEGPWAELRLGELPYATPVLACWLPSDAAAAQLGVVHYLVKPVNQAQLAAAMAVLGPGVRRVLVCDDEPDILRLFVRMLAGLDRPYQILTATSGVEALAALRELRPDAVILDLLMPEMTGFELLQEKAKDPTLRDIPVVVASSLDPFNQPIVTNQLFVARGSGLSSRDLLACIETLSAVLAPGAEPVLRALPAAPGA